MDKYEIYEKYEDFDVESHDRQVHRGRKRPSKTKRKKVPANNGALAQIQQLRAMDESRDSWVPTYVQNFDPKHHERHWVIESLYHFYLNKRITDVNRIIKGGKEANVYACQGHPATGLEWIAAKLYRPRMLRNLKNDAVYKLGRPQRDEEGNEVRGRRERLAMRKKTRFGQDLDFSQWIGMENSILNQLYEAGADVPKPIGYYNNTLLMSFIGDEHRAAPALNEIAIQEEEARPLFDQAMQNVELMLSMGYIHGDLSAYNILYWQGEITLIDFPQMVNAHKNPHAFSLLKRDIERVCDYFNRFGLEEDAVGLSLELWQAFMEGEL